MEQASGERSTSPEERKAAGRRKSSSSQTQETPRPQASSSSSRAGPAALGRTLTAEQAREREKSLAKSALTRAHVTLPFADALGAHLLTALPKEAGGSVIVWSETSILIVTPPLASDFQHPSKATASMPGKRRKASESAGSNPTSGSGRRASTSAKNIADDATDSSHHAVLATSPVSTANEHGKRRRGSVKSASASALATSPLEADTAAGSTSRDDFDGLKILRLSLPRPIQVAAAAVVADPLRPDSTVQVNSDGKGATVHVLFGTAAGSLNDLEVTLSRSSESAAWMPVNMRATKVASIPRPSGSGSISHLGEGIVHIASASGDSAVMQLSPRASSKSVDEQSEDAEMVSLPASPPPTRNTSSSTHHPSSSILSASQKLVEGRAFPDLPDCEFSAVALHKYPSLAPILDFVIDGNANAASGGAQARIVAACGTGPDGAIAVVKTGVSLTEHGGVGLSGVRQVWTVALPDGGVTVICGFNDHTRVLTITAQGITDNTSELGTGSLATSRTMCAAPLPGHETWVHVSDKQVTILDAVTGQQATVWDPTISTGTRNTSIVAASVDGSQALVALNGGQLVLLEVFDDTVRVISSLSTANEISSLHLAHGVAAVGQWGTNAVLLFAVDQETMKDVTPSALTSNVDGLGGLPLSCLVHEFSENSLNDRSSPPSLTLLVGLSTGSLVSFQLALPTLDSFSKTIGAFNRKTSAVGQQPLRLSAFTTSLSRRAVLATNGTSANVVWAGPQGRLSFSTLDYPSVFAGAPLQLPGADPSVILALPDVLQLSSIGELGQLEITKKETGLDNPCAITGLLPDSRGVHKLFAVATNPFRPEGNATREQRKAKILIVDATTLSVRHTVKLETNERANCVTALMLEGTEHLIVGTGFVKPDETETTDGRILGYTLDTVQQHSSVVSPKLVFERHVNGNVYAAASAGGKLLCAVNSEVISFGYSDSAPANEDAMEEDDQTDHEKTFTALSRWGCAFIACTLSPVAEDSNRVVVGDALRSLCVLEVDPSRGQITEIARDCDPFWTSAAACLDAPSQTFIGADISFNLYTSQRASLSPETRRRIEREQERRKERAQKGDSKAHVTSSNDPPLPPADEPWSHVMERRGAWHYGDLINRIREGCLVPKTAAARMDTRLVFATASGAVGIVSTLDEAAGKILSQLEYNLREVIAPLGGISHHEWRTLRTDHRRAEPAGFVDGDLLKRYSDGLSAEAQAKVLQGRSEGAFYIGVDATAEEVGELVDGLSRVC